MPVLHLLCGKIASGKSTLARSLSLEHSAIMISEDHWLAGLYPGQISSVADYVRHARQIREVLGPLVIDILKAGAHVILDFPANTPQDRKWLSHLADVAGARHCVHYLEVEDALCRERLRARNALGEHDFAASDAEFDLITSYFRAPEPAEGLEVVIHQDLSAAREAQSKRSED